MRSAALLLAAGVLWAQAWTPELSLQVQTVGEVVPSPDGKLAAYTQTRAIVETERSESVTQIFLGRPGAPPVQLTRGERGASAPAFSPDGRWVYFRAARSGRAQVWRVATGGGEAEQVTDFRGAVSQYGLSPDGKWIAFTGVETSDEEERARREKRDFRVLAEQPRFPSLWIAPAEGAPAARKLLAPAYEITAFAWSPDSRSLALVHQPTPGPEYSLRSDISEVDVASATVRPVTATRADERDPHYSPDGRFLAYLRSSDPPRSPRDYRIVLAPRPGGGARVLPATYDELPELAGWSPDSARLLFTEGKGFRRVLYAMPVDGPAQVVYDPARGTAGAVRLSGAWAGFSQESSDQPPEAFVLKLGEKVPVEVSRANPNLPKPAASTQLVRWKAPDGWEIEGLLTYPAGYEKGKRYPLVLNIHGGPHSAFTDGFLGRGLYPLAAWAARGYAILRPNPRGSTSYGKAFRYANQADWGGKDYQDLMAGVDHVIALGVADPQRLAVAGWSYGGYMTSWVITQTRRFRAASVGAGVSNILSQAGTSDIRSNKIEAFGAPWEDPGEYLKRSPLLHLKGVDAPTLILHGEADERVPISQGYELYHALRRIGVPARMVVYPRAPHGVTEPKFVADIQRRLLEWMDRYLK